jgi:hypothetical protein
MNIGTLELRREGHGSSSRETLALAAAAGRRFAPRRVDCQVSLWIIGGGSYGIKQKCLLACRTAGRRIRQGEYLHFSTAPLDLPLRMHPELLNDPQGRLIVTLDRCQNTWEAQRLEAIAQDRLSGFRCESLSPVLESQPPADLGTILGRNEAAKANQRAVVLVDQGPLAVAMLI